MIFSVSLSLISFTNIFAQESSEEGMGGSGGESTIISVNTIASIATAGGFGVLAYETIRLNKESKRKHRAWIGDMNTEIDFIYKYANNDEALTADEINKIKRNEPEKFEDFGELESRHGKITLKNFGEIPAYGILGRQKIFLDNIPSEDERTKIKFGFPFTIMPSSQQQYIFPVGNELDEIAAGKMGFLFYEIKYYSEESDKEKIYGFIEMFSNGIHKRIEVWDERKIYTKDGVKEKN